MVVPSSRPIFGPSSIFFIFFFATFSSESYKLFNIDYLIPSFCFKAENHIHSSDFSLSFGRKVTYILLDVVRTKHDIQAMRFSDHSSIVPHYKIV